MWLSDLFKTSQSRRYFDLLVRQATILGEAARTLLKYYETGDGALAEEVDRLERSGDETLKLLVEAIRDSFITPIDRQDLYYLGEAIDDMTDYMESAAVEFKLFGLTATPAMREMCAALVAGTAEIEAAVGAIADDPSKAYLHARAASATEDQVEDLYRKALADLFSGDDFRFMLKTREIYRHLSNSADRADYVGKVISKIVVKTT
jgi:predicted phosphate transport protein (TIGR00153 family)